MTSSLSRLSLVLSAALLTAACSHVSRPDGVKTGGDAAAGPLAVEAGASAPVYGTGWSKTLLPAAQAHFPAASADGTTIVDLIHDAQDFSGIPVATVTFWTQAGKADSFRLTSKPGSDDAAAQAREEAKVVAAVNARLSAQRWRPLPLAAKHADADGGNLTLDVGGVTLPFAELSGWFGAPGVGNSERGGGGCGNVTGIDKGFGSRELGFAVFLPRVNLGGDSCVGRLSADLAIVVPVR